MKKLFAFLTVILLLTATAVTVFAAAPQEIRISANQTDVRPGDTVDFTVRVDLVEGCRSGGIVIHYDSNVFEFVSGQCLVSDPFMADFSGGTGVFALAEGRTVSGDLFRFTLRVKDTAPYGNYSVSGTANLRTDAGALETSVYGAAVSLRCDHTFGSWTGADANVHQRSCSSCGNIETENHTWDNGIVTVQPTCKEEGQKRYSCTVCGAEKTESIPKTEQHSYGSFEKADESAHKRICTVCGREETASHTWDGGTVTVKPSCEEEGQKRYSCTTCGAEKTESIPKTEQHSYGPFEKADESAHKRICTVCGREETASHTWDNGTVTVKPTCKEEGQKTYACSGCNAVRAETVAVTTVHTFDNSCDTACNLCGAVRETEHSYLTGWSSDKTGHWHVCSSCGHQKDLAAHVPGKAATETTPQRCTECGYMIKAALGHQHSYAKEYSSDESGHWYACGGCEERDAAGHGFDNDCDTLCDTCGYTRQIEHAPGEAWSCDAAGHWQECTVCGQQLEASDHIPGPEATEDAAQCCTVCGFETAPVLEAVETAGETTDPEPSETIAIQENEGENDPAQSRFSWWPVIIALAAAGCAAAAFVIMRKRGT